jgi:ubiquinone/menaquinone biosynthesis C-methylase UbiE
MTGGDTKQVQRLFDTQASAWPAKYAPGGPLVGRLAGLSEAVGRYVQAGGQVLDLGCGTGELARALAESGIRIAGCDISAQMLRHASAEPGGCAGWVQLDPDWRRLPFASAAFDAVVAGSVLEYVPEPAVVLRECARVLRPGGVVLCTVPDLGHPVRWAEWLARMATGMIPVRAKAAGRWHRYRAYLRSSRQRHRVRWWLAVSARAGLRPVRYPGRAVHSSLRLLVLGRPGTPS